MAMQAIETKVLLPTDTKGLRVKAMSASGRSNTVEWGSEWDGEQNAAFAAEVLSRSLNWIEDDQNFSDVYVCGSTRDGYVFVRKEV